MQRRDLLRDAVHEAIDEPEVQISDPVTNPTMPFPGRLCERGRADRPRPQAESRMKTHIWRPACVGTLLVVADGMGAMLPAGSRASWRWRTIHEAFASEKFGSVRNPKRALAADELARAIDMANVAILRESKRVAAYHGMGTTVVALRFMRSKQRVYIAHAGDSRCYRIRDAAIKQLTKDHTLGSMLGTKGPNSGTLVRAVGISESAGVELSFDEPHEDDRYSCSARMDCRRCSPTRRSEM